MARLVGYRQCVREVSCKKEERSVTIQGRDSLCERVSTGIRARRQRSSRRALAILLTIASGEACAPSASSYKTPDTTSARPMSNSFADVPASLQGVWTREWIERLGVRTNTFDVHYLQTPSHFADVRFPLQRGVSSRAASFADLTDEELRRLAKQRGFTGRTTLDGAISTWHHEIDFQPPDGSDDIGRIERGDEMHMFEHALDSSYVESWRKVNNGEGRFLAVRVERGGRLDRTLLIAGDYFLFVRNRVRDLPSAPSLDSLIATTHATRAEIIAFLDCEFSAGRVRGGRVPWEIEKSTLPWMEGKGLAFIGDIEVASGNDVLRPRQASEDVWSVPVNTMPRAAIDSLFASPKSAR